MLIVLQLISMRRSLKHKHRTLIMVKKNKRNWNNKPYAKNSSSSYFPYSCYSSAYWYSQNLPCSLWKTLSRMLFFTSCVLHQLLQVRMHYTIYFDMVKMCYEVSDCALCHSDIEMMCWFEGVVFASASHYNFVHMEYISVLYKACCIHL